MAAKIKPPCGGKRILIFNVNWLGDVLFSTAVIRNIRYNFPDSFIACAAPQRCAQVLEGNPHLDEIIIFDEKAQHKGLFPKLKFAGLLKSRRFDAVFLLHRSFSRALICFLAGIPQRIGYLNSKRAFLLTQKIAPPDINSVHRIDYYLGLIERAGLKVKDRHTEFFISKEDAQAADDFLKQETRGMPGFLVGINPGGNWLPKRWPKGHWAKLSDRLIAELNAQVIILGGEADLELADEIQGLMHEKLIFATGKFNLKVLAALCKRLDLFISADTGPLHIANSVEAQRVIALFGPTSAHITGPYPQKNTVVLCKDSGCDIPCYEVGCEDNRCMKAISVDDVIKQVRSLLSL